eukprot:7348051-Alexandrium_andersonii.AAC.1
MRRSIVEWSAASDLELVLDGLPSIPTGTSDQVLATTLLARMLAIGAVVGDDFDGSNDVASYDVTEYGGDGRIMGLLNDDGVVQCTVTGSW